MAGRRPLPKKPLPVRSELENAIRKKATAPPYPEAKIFLERIIDTVDRMRKKGISEADIQKHLEDAHIEIDTLRELLRK